MVVLVTMPRLIKLFLSRESIVFILTAVSERIIVLFITSIRTIIKTVTYLSKCFQTFTVLTLELSWCTILCKLSKEKPKGIIVSRYTRGDKKFKVLLPLVEINSLNICGSVEGQQA